MSMKFEIVHVDTCLSGFWGGHHKAHVSIPVWNGMSLADVKSSILNEIIQGCVSGSDRTVDLLATFEGVDSEEVVEAYAAVKKAVDAMQVADGVNPDHLFNDLDVLDDDEVYDDPVQAYFLIVESDC